MHTDLLFHIVIIFAISAAAVFFLNKIKVPSVIGFLLAGILIGPHGISLIKDQAAIEVFAESGVILLLFTLGIEFSLSKLLRMKKIVFGAGSIQILSTIIITTIIAENYTNHTTESIFAGFLVALSSTAIVIKILADRKETQTPHGRAMIGILLLQDLCVVLFMVLIPVLSGQNDNPLMVLWLIAKAVLIVIAVIVTARFLVPPLFNQIVKTRNRELFIISIILFCFGTALITHYAGLSLALGAFLAGMVISESEYAHQATSDVIPFKESFMGLFFVSVGMLLDTKFMFSHFFTVILIVLAVIVVKTLLAFLSALSANLTVRTSLITGMGLSQVGEFSFVLAIAGQAAGLIPDNAYQLFLSASILTMIATPFIIRYAPMLSYRLVSLYPSRLMRSHEEFLKKDRPPAHNGHVVIIGFGFNGQSLARVLKDTGIDYVVAETNSETVKEKKKLGEPIIFGDATGREILNRLGVKSARLLVCTVPDPFAQRSIIAVAKQINPCIYIITRTRFISSIAELKKLGANEVIPEEFETAIEIFSRTLQLYKYPPGIVNELAERVRSDNYSILRKAEGEPAKLNTRINCLPEIEFDGYMLPNDSLLAGKTIEELNIRQVTGITVIAIRRNEDVTLNPPADFRLMPGDIILFTGKRNNMEDALVYFREMTESNAKE
jgi:CPA2 family monovalent cation:H+ antiporter-2